MKSNVALGLMASLLAGPLYAIPPKNFGKSSSSQPITTRVAEPGEDRLKNAGDSLQGQPTLKGKKLKKPDSLKKK